MNTDDIHAAHLAKRQIVFREEVTAQLQIRISTALEYLNALNDRPVTLFIDSCGGSSFYGMSIYDAIRNSRAPVRGIVTAEASSMAFIILQACHRRLAYENAELMFHSGQLNKVKLDRPDLFRYIRRERSSERKVLELIRARSGQPLAKIRRWSFQEHRFDSRSALELGFIDEVVTPPELPRAAKIQRPKAAA